MGLLPFGLLPFGPVAPSSAGRRTASVAVAADVAVVSVAERFLLAYSSTYSWPDSSRISYMTSSMICRSTRRSLARSWYRVTSIGRPKRMVTGSRPSALEIRRNRVLGGGSSSALSSALAAFWFSSSARSTMTTRQPASPAE